MTNAAPLLVVDLARLEAAIAHVTSKRPDECWLEALAALAEDVERAQHAGLSQDDCLALNAMQIRHGLHDPRYRIT